MSATAELAQRVRLSDPRPDRCAACFRGAEEGVRFVDFDAAIDRGQVVTEVDGGVLHRESIDDLHLCEACVRSAAEVFAIKPQIHSNALREIKRLEIERDHWRSYAKRIEATVAERPKDTPKTRTRKAGR